MVEIDPPRIAATRRLRVVDLAENTRFRLIFDRIALRIREVNPRLPRRQFVEKFHVGHGAIAEQIRPRLPDRGEVEIGKVVAAE